jgi:hypothetical protein
MAVRRIAHPSVTDRSAEGRQTRDRTPLSSHQRWAPAPDRPDPVALLEDQGHRLGVEEVDQGRPGHDPLADRGDRSFDSTRSKERVGCDRRPASTAGIGPLPASHESSLSDTANTRHHPRGVKSTPQPAAALRFTP